MKVACVDHPCMGLRQEDCLEFQASLDCVKMSRQNYGYMHIYIYIHTHIVHIYMYIYKKYIYIYILIK